MSGEVVVMWHLICLIVPRNQRSTGSYRGMCWGIPWGIRWGASSCFVERALRRLVDDCSLGGCYSHLPAFSFSCLQIPSTKFISCTSKQLLRH